MESFVSCFIFYKKLSKNFKINIFFFIIRTINYDVCKLYLKEKLDLSKPEIAAIPLCSVEPTGTCLISGWGSVDPDGRSGTDKLQKLFSPITPRAQCQENFNGVNTVTDAMICIGGKEGEGGCKKSKKLND